MGINDHSLEKVGVHLKEMLSMPDQRIDIWVSFTQDFNQVIGSSIGDMISTVGIDEWYYLRTQEVLCCKVVPRDLLQIVKFPFVKKIDLEGSKEI